MAEYIEDIIISLINHVPVGARFMILSAIGFSIMGMFVKAAGQAGIPVLEIVAARSLISVVLSYLAVRRLGIPLLGHRRGLLLARGIIGFAALTCVYYALTRLPFAEATVLQYLHPMFTALIAIVFLNEHITRGTLACIAISFLGLLCIVQPDALFIRGSAAFDKLGILAAIAGAFGSGCAYVLVKKLSETEHPAVIVFYFPMVSLPATLPFIWNSFVVPEGITWLYLIGVGIFTQIGQVALTKGMQTETASRATSFSYLQVVFAAILGVLVFGEVPSLLTIIGALLIIMGSFVNVVWRTALK